MRCLDNFSTGKEINIQQHKNEIELIKGDIRDYNVVKTAVTDIDYVYHLAAQISVARSVREPTFDAEVNINGMINLLKAIRRSSVKKIVYVSTGGAIYGESDIIPAPETTAAEPISPYGLNKFIGEKYLELYNRLYGINYTIIRPANIYGPRQDPLGEAGVISIFLGNVRNGESLNIYGDGTDTRDYVFVKDIIDICIKAMNSSHVNIFNAGTGKQTNLLELAELIGSVTKNPVKKVFSPRRPGDVKHIALNIDKAKELLNWNPSVDLYSGILETWKWFLSI